ncbi:cyclin-T1-5-like [Hordeum vulgare]|nr:cyclin-T1-5-like [Hordeum vulgare]
MYQAIPYSAGRLPAWPRRSEKAEAEGAGGQEGAPTRGDGGEAGRRAVAESPVLVVGRRTVAESPMLVVGRRTVAESPVLVISTRTAVAATATATAAAMSFSQPFHPDSVRHRHHPYHHDSPPPHRPRPRGRDHDDAYHIHPQSYPQPCSYTNAATAPYHVRRDPLPNPHLQEPIFPQPPQRAPAPGPPPPKRARRAPEPRCDPPAAAVPRLLPTRQPEDGDTRALLSREEIERRSPSWKDGIDSALEARLRASYCAYLRCLGFRLGL